MRSTTAAASGHSTPATTGANNATTTGAMNSQRSARCPRVAAAAATHSARPKPGWRRAATCTRARRAIGWRASCRCRCAGVRLQPLPPLRNPLHAAVRPAHQPLHHHKHGVQLVPDRFHLFCQPRQRHAAATTTTATTATTAGRR